MAGDVTTKATATAGITEAHWVGATTANGDTATAGIKREAVDARAGEYLIYKFTASTAA